MILRKTGIRHHNGDHICKVQTVQSQLRHLRQIPHGVLQLFMQAYVVGIAAAVMPALIVFAIPRHDHIIPSKCIRNFYRIDGIGVQGDPVTQFFYIGDGLFQFFHAAQLFFRRHQLRKASVMTALVPAHQLQLRTLNTVSLQAVRNIPHPGKCNHRMHLRLIFRSLVQDWRGTLLPTHTNPDQRILSGILHSFPLAFFRQRHDLAPLQPQLPLCRGKIAQGGICLHGHNLHADIIIDRIVFREIKHRFQRIDPILDLERKGILVVTLNAYKGSYLRRFHAVAGHDRQIILVACVLFGNKSNQQISIHRYVSGSNKKALGASLCFGKCRQNTQFLHICKCFFMKGQKITAAAFLDTGNMNFPLVIYCCKVLF